jgi:hypothetical protein
MAKKQRSKKNKPLPEKDKALRRKRLESLLAELEAMGRDPHDEIDWGKDIGKEQF